MRKTAYGSGRSRPRRLCLPSRHFRRTVCRNIWRTWKWVSKNTGGEGEKCEKGLKWDLEDKPAECEQTSQCQAGCEKIRSQEPHPEPHTQEQVLAATVEEGREPLEAAAKTRRKNRISINLDSNTQFHDRFVHKEAQGNKNEIANKPSVIRIDLENLGNNEPMKF